MRKRIGTCVVITVAILVLLVSLTGGSTAHAQMNSTASESTSSVSTNVSFTSISTSSSSQNSSTSLSSMILQSSTDTISSSASQTEVVTSASTDSSSSDSVTSNFTTVTVTSTTTTGMSSVTSTSGGSDYSIAFYPTYWPCTDVSVTFSGPLIESGYYGDTLQFQYFQYNPTYPSILSPIFTDSDLTVTGDTVDYWISYTQYAQVNFAYQPYIAVKVVDITAKSNGYSPGLIFMQLTDTTPYNSQYCQYDPAIPTPEFPAQWLIIVTSMLLGLAVLRVRNRFRTKGGMERY